MGGPSYTRTLATAVAVLALAATATAAPVRRTHGDDALDGGDHNDRLEGGKGAVTLDGDCENVTGPNTGRTGEPPSAAGGMPRGPEPGRGPEG
jgi:Ca2+-binding RTX toxin-like protein